QPTAITDCESRWPHSAFHVWSVAVNRHSLRTRASVPGAKNKSEQFAEGRRAQLDKWSRTRAYAAATRHFRSGARVNALSRRRINGAQLRASAIGRSRA